MGWVLLQLAGLGALCHFLTGVSWAAVLAALGVIFAVVIFGAWGRFFRVIVGRWVGISDSKWLDVALGHVFAAGLFLFLSRFVDSFFLLGFFVFPLILELLYARAAFLVRWRELSFLDFVGFALMANIFWSHTHTLGGIGHDTIQHIYWVNSILDSGYVQLQARGTLGIELYPKGFHGLVALWAQFVPRDFSGPLVKGMPALQMVLAVLLVLDRFLSARKSLIPGILLLLLVSVLNASEDNRLQDGTPRLSGIFVSTLFLYLIWEFRNTRSWAPLVAVALSYGVLLAFSPAFAILAVPAVLLLAPRWRVLLQHKARIVGLCCLTFGVLITDPYYFGFALKVIGGIFPGTESYVGLAVPWLDPQMASAASPIALSRQAFSMELFGSNWHAIWDMFPLRRAGDYLFPILLSRSHLTGYWVCLLLLVFLKRRSVLSLSGFLWVTLLASGTLLALIPSNSHIIHLLRSYSVGVLSLSLSVPLQAVLLSELWEKRGRQLDISVRIKSQLLRKLLCSVLAVSLSYLSFWTFMTVRGNGLGRVTASDMASLRAFEAEVGELGVFLPCETPPKGQVERWHVSRPSSTLFSLGKKPEYYCNFFIGKSLYFSVKEMEEEVCVDPKRAAQVWRRHGVSYAAFWAGAGLAPPASAKDVIVCDGTRSLYDLGFSLEPVKRFGLIFVFGR